MALASSVLGFEVVELWSDEGDGRIHCTYVHAEESFIKRYPDIITGHYPNHRRKHVLSPMVILCLNRFDTIIFSFLLFSYVS